MVSALTGCKGFDPPPPRPFQVTVKVESDPGRPLAEALVVRDNKTLATTGADGRALLTLSGTDGEVVDFHVRCPERFQSPVKATSVRLTRLAEKSKIPEYGILCPPTTRRVVVAVKAENGPNLPVVILNRMVARTDTAGAAHFTLDVQPGAQFNVTLDTSEKGNERIKPQNPSKPFAAGQQDDVILFEQKFQVEKKPAPFVARPSIPRALN